MSGLASGWFTDCVVEFARLKNGSRWCGCSLPSSGDHAARSVIAHRARCPGTVRSSDEAQDRDERDDREEAEEDVANGEAERSGNNRGGRASGHLFTCWDDCLRTVRENRENSKRRAAGGADQQETSGRVRPSGEAESICWNDSRRSCIGSSTMFLIQRMRFDSGTEG